MISADVPNQSPLKPLIDRLGLSIEEVAQITGLSESTVIQATHPKAKGSKWLLLLYEVDRLHRLNTAVLEAENELLKG